MRIKLLAGANSDLVPFAKRKLAQAQERRLRFNLPFVSRWYSVDGALIKVHSAAQNEYIMILGGGGGQILLANLNGTAGRSWVYDYNNDSLSYATGFTALTLAELHPNFNRTSHYGEQVAITYTGSATVSDLDPVYDFVANSQLFELELLASGAALYTRGDQGFNELGTRPSGAFAWEDTLAASQDTFIYLPRTHNNMWNQINGLELWVYAPSTGHVFPSAWWVPNILYAEAGNSVLVTGFYYGQLGGRYVSKEDPTPSSPGEPASVVKVTFNSLMDGRKPSAILPYGYAETLVSMDDEVFNTIYFYLSFAPVPDYGNPSILYQSLLQNRDAGTEMHGKAWTFSYTPSFSIPSSRDYTVSFWNCPDNRPESIIPYEQDYVGCVVSYQSNADVFLWTGVRYTLMTTTNYHSHSYSQDGTILAVFEGSTLIDRVRVFDLQSREELRDSSVVAPIMAQTGCFIPVRGDNFTPYTASIPTIPNVFTDPPEFLTAVAPFGSIQYNNQYPKRLHWKKVICEDGIHAYTQETDDPCFVGNVTIIRPDAQPPTGEYTIVVAGAEYRGVWGAVVSQLPYVLFSSSAWPYEVALCTWANGIGVPVSATIDRGAVYEIAAPNLHLEGNPIDGGYIPVGCLQGCGEVVEGDPPTADCEDQYYDAARVSDGCGRTARYQALVPATSSVPSIDTPADGDFVDEGTAIEISGGKLPYVVTFTLGGVTRVDSNSFEIGGVDACFSGASRWGTIEVTDKCGHVASVDVLVASGGAWCCNPIGSPCGGGFASCSPIDGPDVDDRIGCSSPGTSFVRPLPSGVQDGGFQFQDLYQCFDIAGCNCTYSGNVSAATTADCLGDAPCFLGTYTLEWLCP